MGNELNSLSLKDVNIPNNKSYQQICQKHTQKLLSSRLKTYEEFSTHMTTISVRCSYLNYGWTKWLCQQISEKLPVLYSQYKEQIEYNIRSKGDRSKFFYVRNLEEIFMQQFVPKCQCLIQSERDKKDGFSGQSKEVKFQSLSRQNLRIVSDEAKSFLMIKSWFEEFYTQSSKRGKENPKSKVSVNGKQNVSNEKMSIQKTQVDENGQSQSRGHHGQSKEKIISMILRLNELYYDAQLQHYDFHKFQIQSKPDFMTPELTIAVKIVSKTNDLLFRIKEIEELLNYLEKSSKNDQLLYEKYARSIVGIFGLKAVLCWIQVIKDFGSVDSFQKITQLSKIVQSMTQFQEKKMNLRDIDKNCYENRT